MKTKWSPKIKLNTSGVAVMSENSGFYKLYSFNDRTKKYKLVYVGQSMNLKRELALHLPWREVNPQLRQIMKTTKCFFTVQEFSHGNTESKDSAHPLRRFLRAINAPYFERMAI